MAKPRATRYIPRQPSNIDTYKQSIFRRTVEPVRIIAAPLTNTYNGYYFTLSGLPGFGELTSVFDQYRFLKIEVRYHPEYSESQVGQELALGFLATCIDFDDSSAPASVGAVLEYNNHSITSLLKDHRRSFRPRAALGVYQAGVFSGFGMAPPGQWCDMASPNIQHYGLKSVIKNDMNISITYLLTITCTVACRAAR
jgi:hypothetical protein